MNKKIILAMAVSMVGFATWGTEPDSTVLGRASRQLNEAAAALEVAWENPAVNQWRRDFSLNDIAVRFDMRDEDRPVDAMLGDRDLTWSFDARSYMKHRSNTLWGRAFYDNGHIDNITWNETSEPQMAYPYLLADAVGGRMNVERYSFMGGYASHNDTWSWGGEMGYTAGLYYRDVDPRPRNVTARLQLAAGAGRNVSDNYLVAASLAFMKYKQTNNVAFYSELGNEKLFHLTGLGNDYRRFAGTAYSTYYKGYRWAATLNLHPTGGRGLALATTLATFSLDNVLTTLNKLPMAHVGLRKLEAEAAWLDSTFFVTAHLNASRRVGTENIFGDATAGVYNQIAALDNYHENRVSLDLEGAWTPSWQGGWSARLQPAVGYRHLNAIYASPQARRLLNLLTTGLTAQASKRHRATLWTLVAGTGWHHPTAQELTLPSSGNDETAALARVIADNHDIVAANFATWNTALHVTVAINRRYAIAARLDYRHGHYRHGPSTHHLTTSLSLLF